MTTTEERITRIEALTLELAAVNLRQNHTTDQQQDQLERINERLDRIDAQQERNSQTIAQLAAQQSVNQEAIAQFTAGLMELRTLVANCIQSRSQI